MKKNNSKKTWFIVLCLLILLIFGLIGYLEFDHIIFKKQIDKMNVQTKSLSSSAEHKILKMDGYGVHYFVSGKQNSDAMVFLHPAFSNHNAFDQQIEYFSKNYRVITIDLIGHGLSQANQSKDKIDSSSEHINKILYKEGVKKTHLVGVSLGGLIAQYFALKYPEKTASLTALAAYDINKENKEVAKAQRASNMGLIIRALFSMNAFKKKTAELSCKTEQGRALFYKTAKHYTRKSLMVMQGLQNIIKDRALVKASYSTLILTGDSDIDLAKKMAKEWHSAVMNSEFFIIENAGHCANMDNPNEFNKQVDEFIKRGNIYCKF